MNSCPYQYTPIRVSQQSRDLWTITERHRLGQNPQLYQSNGLISSRLRLPWCSMLSTWAAGHKLIFLSLMLPWCSMPSTWVGRLPLINSLSRFDIVPCSNLICSDLFSPVSFNALSVGIPSPSARRRGLMYASSKRRRSIRLGNLSSAWNQSPASLFHSQNYLSLGAGVNPPNVATPSYSLLSSSFQGVGEVRMGNADWRGGRLSSKLVETRGRSSSELHYSLLGYPCQASSFVPTSQLLYQSLIPCGGHEGQHRQGF